MSYTMSSSASYKQKRNAELKKIIERESTFRKQQDDLHQVMSNRVLLWKIRDMDNVQFAGGIDTDLFPLITSEAQCKRLENILESGEEGQKYSLWKEKFLRYVHNNDAQRATKYHHKCEEYENKSMEDMVENPKTTGCVVFGGGENNMGLTPDALPQNEGGYIKMCDEFKKAYEFRMDLLAHM